MSNLPPKMYPEDALKDGQTPGDVVRVDVDGVPRFLPGAGGASGTNSYHHNQGSASATWDIVHNLGFKPNVMVEDSAHTVIEGAGIEHVDANHLILTFSAPFTGDAYLS